MNAVAEQSPFGRRILRLWSASTGLLGSYLFVDYAAWFIPQSSALYAWGGWVVILVYIVAGALCLEVASIGLVAFFRPGAAACRRLAVLTAWLLWYGLLSARLLLLGKLGGPTLAGAGTPWDNFFNALFAIAALIACRCMYAWMKQHAPLPEAERAEIPNGLRSLTLVVFSIFFGILTAVAALQGLGAVGLAPKSMPLARIDGVWIAVALAAASYFLLMKSLAEPVVKVRAT